MKLSINRKMLKEQKEKNNDKINKKSKYLSITQKRNKFRHKIVKSLFFYITE